MMHKVGDRISSYRKERNMSQEELATILNVSRQTISKWETGDTLPDVFNAVAISKLFHISLDTLVLGANNSTGNSSYMSELRIKKQSTNLKAMIVGSIGSTIFAVSLILLKALDVQEPYVGVTMAIILPVLMFCWGFAIWGFIKVSRLSDEIKYLQRIEMTTLQYESLTKKLDSK